MGSPTPDDRRPRDPADADRSVREPRTVRVGAPVRAPAGGRPATARRRASAWRQALPRDLGGPAGLSVQERTLVEVATHTYAYLSALDAWLLDQPGLVEPRRRAVLPALRERTQVAEGLGRCLQALGLGRRQPAQLADYLAARAPAATAAAPRGAARPSTR